MPKVLIVEDDDSTRKGLIVNFQDEGYDVLALGNGSAVLETALAERPDLVILDVMLPGSSGFDICRLLRDKGVHMPIILLTARTAEPDRIKGFETGADDYVLKPFSIRELLARARVQLRHAHNGSAVKSAGYRFGDVEVEFKNRSVMRNGHAIALTRKEFELLEYLILHRGDLLPREQILAELWGYERQAQTRTVDTHIFQLRQKLEADPSRPAHIISVYGSGYKFVS